jgi:hypothetical protein
LLEEKVEPAKEKKLRKKKIKPQRKFEVDCDHLIPDNKFRRIDYNKFDTDEYFTNSDFAKKAVIQKYDQQDALNKVNSPNLIAFDINDNSMLAYCQNSKNLIKFKLDRLNIGDSLSKTEEKIFDVNFV